MVVGAEVRFFLPIAPPMIGTITMMRPMMRMRMMMRRGNDDIDDNGDGLS